MVFRLQSWRTVAGLLGAVFIFIGGRVQAAEYQLELARDVPIYEKPEAGARVIGRAYAGENLKSEQRPRRSPFYPVEFKSRSGRWRRGYISAREAGSSRLKRIVDMRSSYGVGVSAILSVQNQGARELATSPDTKYSITEFSGHTLFFRVFADLPLSGVWAARLGLSLRSTSMRGDAVLAGGGQMSTFELTQKFIAADGLLKRYMFFDGFWLGAGFEAAKGTAVDLKVVAGTPVDSSGIEKPFFAIFSAGVGYDWFLSQDFYLTPEGRVGGVITTDPFTLLYEGVVNIGYKL